MVVERSPLLLDSTFPMNGDDVMANHLGYTSTQPGYMGRNYIYGDRGWELVGPDEIPKDMPYSDIIPEQQILTSEQIYDTLALLKSFDVVFNTYDFLGFNINYDDGWTTVEHVVERLYRVVPKPNFEDISIQLKRLQDKESDIQNYRFEGMLDLYSSSGLVASMWYGLSDEQTSTPEWYDDKLVHFFSKTFTTVNAPTRPVLADGDAVMDWLRNTPTNKRKGLTTDLEQQLTAFWQTISGYHPKFYDVATTCFGRLPPSYEPAGAWELTFFYESLPHMRMEVSKGKAMLALAPSGRRRNHETHDITEGTKVRIEGRDEVFIVTNKGGNTLTVESENAHYELPRFIFEAVDEELPLTRSDLVDFLSSEGTVIDLPGPVYSFSGENPWTAQPYQWSLIDGYRYFLCNIDGFDLKWVYAPLLFTEMTPLPTRAPTLLPQPPPVRKVEPPTGPSSTMLAMITVGLFVVVTFWD